LRAVGPVGLDVRHGHDDFVEHGGPSVSPSRVNRRHHGLHELDREPPGDVRGMEIGALLVAIERGALAREREGALRRARGRPRVVRLLDGGTGRAPGPPGVQAVLDA
jgi:hypothetical protein